jgi:hypothetical protein
MEEDSYKPIYNELLARKYSPEGAEEAIRRTMEEMVPETKELARISGRETHECFRQLLGN